MILVCSSERSSTVAEEFALDVPAVEGGAVDDDEGAVSSIRGVVDGASHEFLACARFSVDERVEIDGGNACKAGEEFGHRSSSPEERPEAGSR